MNTSCKLAIAGLSLMAMAQTACSSDSGAKTEPDPPGGSADTGEGFVDVVGSAKRVKVTLDSFDLEPGGEIYRCQTFSNPFGRDVAILQTQSSMSSGSHHLAAFRVDENADGPLEDCSGLEFHPTIHAAQTPHARTTFPDGVGAFLAGTEGIRLNAHYFNLGNETIHAKVIVALDYVSPEEVTATAAQIYLNDSTLNIPPGAGSGGGTLALPTDLPSVKIISTQSHMHRRGIGFRATLEDGSMLYETSTWSEPPVKTYAPPLDVAGGTKITWKCDYENETAHQLTFGESADTNEMCVLTGFYYPAPDGKMIVGDLAGSSVKATLTNLK